MRKILSSKLLIPCALAAVAALPLLTASCNTSGCTELRSATPRADFYDSATGTAITLDSLRIVGIGAPGDSVLYNPGESLQSVYLPMRATVNSTQWCIEYCYPSIFGDIHPADIVTFDYTPLPWFAGEECGAMYRYRINNLTYTTNLIDSVSIVDSLVTNIDRATVNIYFRVEINNDQQQ